MKNYSVLADLKIKAAVCIDAAFEKGYDQGYHDGKLDGKAETIGEPEKQFDDEKKAEYDRGFKEGKEAAEDDMCKYYNKHFNDVVNSSNDDTYQRGYEDGKAKYLDACESSWHDGFNHGKEAAEEYNEAKYNIKYEAAYQKGLKHGQELRVKEAECAEACGMKRAWKAIRKIMHMSLFDQDELFPGWDVEDIIDKLSAKEVIEKVEAWEKKQKQTEKNCKECEIHSKALRGKLTVKQIEETCDTCKHGEAYKQGSDITTMDDECGGCCSWNSKWTPKEDTIGNSVKSIGFGDEVVDNLGHVMMVTYIAVESKCADVLKSDGTTDQMPLEILEKTGKHYDIQALLDAMKSEKTEKGVK